MLRGSSSQKEEEVAESKEAVRYHEEKLVKKFKTEVANICTDNAIVFIYVSGIQFPYKVMSL